MKGILSIQVDACPLPLKCYNCRGPHLHRNCLSQDDVVRFHYGLEGHIVRDCPNRQVRQSILQRLVLICGHSGQFWKQNGAIKTVS